MIRIRIPEAQKHMDPTDPDPQHWVKVIKVLLSLCVFETDPQVLYPEQRLGRVVLAASSPGHWSTWVVQSMHCPYGNEARYAFLNKTFHQTHHIYQCSGSSPRGSSSPCTARTGTTPGTRSLNKTLRIGLVYQCFGSGFN
jgi:hypothetical protein